MFIEMIIAAAIGSALTRNSPLFSYAEKAKIFQLCGVKDELNGIKNELNGIKNEIMKIDATLSNMYKQLQWQEIIAIATAKGAKYEGNDVFSFVENKNGVSVKCSLVLNARKVIEQYGSITTTRDLSNNTLEFIDTEKRLEYYEKYGDREWYENGVLIRKNEAFYNDGLSQEIRELFQQGILDQKRNTLLLHKYDIYKNGKYTLVASASPYSEKYGLYDGSKFLLTHWEYRSWVVSSGSKEEYPIGVYIYRNNYREEIPKRLLFDKNKELREQIDREINEGMAIVEDVKKTKPFKIQLLDNCHLVMVQSEETTL